MVPATNARPPVACSAKWGEVCAFRQCSTSSTTFCADRMTRTPRSRSETWSTVCAGREQGRVVEIRFCRGSREQHEIGAADRLGGGGRYIGGAAALAQPRGKRRRPLGDQVVHPEASDAPSGAQEKVDDGRGDRTGADHRHGGRLLASMQQLGAQRRGCRRSRRADVGRFEAGVGKPVAMSFKRIAAEARSSPRLRFSGSSKSI